MTDVTVNNEVTDVTVKQLIAVATELNEVLLLEPAINLKAKKDILIQKIKMAATLIDPRDNFSDETISILKSMDVNVPKRNAPKPKKGAAAVKETRNPYEIFIHPSATAFVVMRIVEEKGEITKDELLRELSGRSLKCSPTTVSTLLSDFSKVLRYQEYLAQDEVNPTPEHTNLPNLRVVLESEKAARKAAEAVVKKEKAAEAVVKKAPAPASEDLVNVSESEMIEENLIDEDGYENIDPEMEEEGLDPEVE